MRVIEFVDEVNMGIYKAGNNEFTMQVEHLCATWKLRQTGVLTDPFDAFAPDDKALVWHHDPTSRVEERRVAKYKIVRRTIFRWRVCFDGLRRQRRRCQESFQ